MALTLTTVGASTTLKELSDALLFEQTNSSNKFKFKENKIILAPNFIYSDSLIIKPDAIVPISNCYLKGNGTATISLLEQVFSTSGFSNKFNTYNANINKIINAIKQNEVSVSALYWSASQSNSANSTTLTNEQNACLNGTNFTSSWYSLNNKAPTLIKAFNSNSSAASIVTSITNKIITITQQSTNNVYYSIGVKLSWVI